MIIEDDHSAFSVLVGGLLGSVAIFPRRNRVGLTPKSALLLPCFSLGLSVTGLDIGGRLRKVARVTPSYAAAHLLKVCVDTVDEDDGQRSPVSVQAVSVQLDLAPEHQIAQMLFGPLAECLRFFRRVNPAQTYPEELVAGHERLYGIAVGNADNLGRDDRLLASERQWPTIRRETRPAPILACLMGNETSDSGLCFEPTLEVFEYLRFEVDGVRCPNTVLSGQLDHIVFEIDINSVA